MKRFAVTVLLALALAAPAAFAQNHGEIGVFADLTRLHNAGDQNFWGVGGRVAFNVSKHVALEGDMAYDFERGIITANNTGGVATFSRANLNLLNGFFGPKIQSGGGALRAFVFAKGGFLNFRGGVTGGVVSGFTSQVATVTTGDTNGAFYPGGGVEAYLGPIGLRVDVGDMMYFDNGANHNLRLTFGPHIRF